MDVRAATVGDLPAVQLLLAAMFAELDTPQVPLTCGTSLTEQLTPRLGVDVGAFVAVDTAATAASPAIGLAGLAVGQLHSAELGSIEWLMIDSRYRGRGLGRAVLAELLTWFDDRVSRVEVQSSAAARRLYLQSGFEPIASGSRSDDGGSGLELSRRAGARPPGRGR